MPMQNPLLNAPAMPPQQAQSGMIPPGGGMMPQGQPMAPGGAPGAPGGMPPAPEQIDEARKHLGAVMGALSKVAAIPQGKLDKQDVYEAAAEMLQKGGFPTPDSRAELIGQLAQMPNDEQGIRSTIGKLMLQIAQVRDQFHAVHGAGQPQGGPPVA